MLEDVIKRLEGLGFTVTDEWVLNFCIDKVTNHIKNKQGEFVLPSSATISASPLRNYHSLQGNI